MEETKEMEFSMEQARNPFSWSDGNRKYGDKLLLVYCHNLPCYKISLILE